MTHDKVYEKFKNLLPVYEKRTVMWFPNGFNSIRVRQMDGKDYIFTLDGEGSELSEMRFETKDIFIKRMRGGKQHVH